MEIGFFFENAEVDQSGAKPSTQQRLLLELARSFIALPSRKHQEAICNLARVLPTRTRSASRISPSLPTIKPSGKREIMLGARR